MLDAFVRPVLLIALVTAAAGPWFVIVLLRPIFGRAGLSTDRVDPIEQQVVRVTKAAAWIALCFSLPELYMQVVDIMGGTIFSGVELSIVWKLLTRTNSGWVWIARTAVLAALLMLLGWHRSWPWSHIRWVAALVLAGAALISRSLASHASSLASGSLVAIVSDALHIFAAASWIGLLIHFRLLLGRMREAETARAQPVLAPIVNRLTPIALASAGVLVGTGIYNATRHLDSLRAIIASPYGLALLAKMLLLAPLLVAGSLNFLVIRPALSSAHPPAKGLGDGGRGALARRLLSLVEIEVSVGLAIIALAAVLSVVPPAVDDAQGTLTLARLAKLFRPRMPRFSWSRVVPGPSPALEQTPDDFSYSEFNHHWAGAALIVMAIGSFLEGLSVRRFRWARAWPAAFLFLAIFLFLRNDPEAWPFGPIGFLESMRIPEMVQHRLSVVLLLALGGVEFLGRRGQVRQSRWAYIFPSLCIVGGLMMFSHTHDMGVAVTDAQTYLAIQHEVMGAFGLLAGLSRWFQLRQPEEGRWFGLLWALFVFLLGLQMFIFYKES